MPDEELNPLARTVVELMKRHTAFAPTILKAQCKHIGRTTASLSAADLPLIAPYLGRAVALFSNPQKGRELEQAIGRLSGRGPT